MAIDSAVIDALFKKYAETDADFIKAFLTQHQITGVDVENPTDLLSHPRFNTRSLKVIGLSHYLLGPEAPEVRAAKAECEKAQTQHQASVIGGWRTYHRYCDFPRKSDPQFPRYNINQLPAPFSDIYLAEGPENTGDSFDRFIEALQIIGHSSILAIGASYEGGRSKYYQYTQYMQKTGELHHLHYGKLTHIDNMSSIRCVQIPDWKDHSDFKFTPQEIAALLQWLADPTKSKVLHCSAGLGRSGTLMAAYMLAKSYPDYAYLEEAARADVIVAVLGILRAARPGAVQQPAQITMLDELAKQFAILLPELTSDTSQMNSSFDLSTYSHVESESPEQTPLQNSSSTQSDAMVAYRFFLTGSTSQNILRQPISSGDEQQFCLFNSNSASPLLSSDDDLPYLSNSTMTSPPPVSPERCSTPKLFFSRSGRSAAPSPQPPSPRVS